MTATIHPHAGMAVMGQPAGPRHRSDTDGRPGHGGGPAVGMRVVPDPSTEPRPQQGDPDRERAAWLRELDARRVRARVASRLEVFSVRHAEHAWQLRNKFGVAPTAVALLYLDPGDDGMVKVAGKLFPDTDQVADPVRVLYDVCALARDVTAHGQDPRDEMSENPDPMSGDAFLVGVCVSMLDTPEGLWRDVRTRDTGGGHNIPGRVLALLVDDTMLLADRREHHQLEHYRVASTGYLDGTFAGLSRRWRYAPDLAVLDRPDTRPLWLRLAELRSVLTGGAHGE